MNTIHNKFYICILHFFFPIFSVFKRLKMTCKWSRFNKERKKRGRGRGKWWARKNKIHVGCRREEKVRYIGPISYNVHFIVVL